MWFIVSTFVVGLVIAILACYLSEKMRWGMQADIPAGRHFTGGENIRIVEVGLRAATVLALLATIGVVLRVLSNVTRGESLTRFNLGTSDAWHFWPIPVIISVLIFGLTAVALCALLMIGRIVRQD
jgi:hypothetical protein